MYEENKENLCFSSKSFQHNQHIPPSRTPLAPIHINLNPQKPLSLQKRKKPPIQRLGPTFGGGAIRTIINDTSSLLPSESSTESQFSESQQRMSSPPLPLPPSKLKPQSQLQSVQTQTPLLQVHSQPPLQNSCVHTQSELSLPSQVGSLQVRQLIPSHSQQQQSISTQQPQPQQSIPTHSQSQQSISTHSQSQQSISTQQPQPQQSIPTHSQSQQSISTHSQSQQSIPTQQPQPQQSIPTHSQSQQSIPTQQPQPQQSIPTHSQSQQSIPTQQPQPQQSIPTHSQRQQLLSIESHLQRHSPQLPSQSPPQPLSLQSQLSSFQVQPQTSSPQLPLQQPQSLSPKVPVLSPLQQYQHYQQSESKQNQDLQQQRQRHKQQIFDSLVHCVPTRRTVTVSGRRYLRLRLLGHGGSSKVYQVIGEDLVCYALKVVRLSEHTAVSSFINELHYLHSLRNQPNIINLLDAELTQNHIFMILELGDGNLGHLLERNGTAKNETISNQQTKPNNVPDWNEIRFYWSQMLRAVDTVHQRGIVHGDLKPSNFVLVRGRLKLIDFGIASTIQPHTACVIRENAIGTLAYMAPETLQVTYISDDNTTTTRPVYCYGLSADIWSLGCILYQMVYGYTPFHHLSTNDKVKAITNPNTSIEFPPLSNELCIDVLKKCLQYQPQDRPTANQLIEHSFLK